MSIKSIYNSDRNEIVQQIKNVGQELIYRADSMISEEIKKHL